MLVRCKSQLKMAKLLSSMGIANIPITKGFACVKMARYPERHEQHDGCWCHKKRKGPKGTGQFEAISWSKRFPRLRSERERRSVTWSSIDIALAMEVRWGSGEQSASRIFSADRRFGVDQTICASTGGAGWEANYGPSKLGTDPEDLVHARYIVLWGINALRSNSHIAPVLKEARHRGARILHIDPFRNETSKFADEHWQIRVGTDAALALAIANEIFDRDARR